MQSSIVPFSSPPGFGSAPVDFSRQLWVEVTAATFVRRVKLTAVPYALLSATADTLGIECAPVEILVVDKDGEWACGVIPAAQLCEAGDVLGRYTAPRATQGVGVCRNGTRSCQSGAWGSCVGQTLPVAEDVAGSPTYCNGVDDDCDGVVGSHEADADNDGVFICDGDCDDQDPTVTRGCRKSAATGWTTTATASSTRGARRAATARSLPGSSATTPTQPTATDAAPRVRSSRGTTAWASPRSAPRSRQPRRQGKARARPGP